MPESKGRAASVNVNGVNNIKWQEAEGEQGRGRISELAETLNQMEANIAEVTMAKRQKTKRQTYKETLNQMEANIAEVTNAKRQKHKKKRKREK